MSYYAVISQNYSAIEVRSFSTKRERNEWVAKPYPNNDGLRREAVTAVKALKIEKELSSPYRRENRMYSIE